jgi:very-short-patch-repair endonuclease
MDYLYLFIAFCAIGYVIYTKPFNKINSTEIKKALYSYQAKQYFMTKSENDFFHMLNNVAGDRYFIFPQVHLSAILDEKIKNGQNWNAAFKHINGKSVDYILCDKQTSKPIYAVELDDYTHNYSNRQERDQEVERMFQSAGIPLVRFNDYKTLNQEDIAKRFIEARNQQ